MKERASQMKDLVPLVNHVTTAFDNSSQVNSRMKHARDLRRLAFMIASSMRDVTMSEEQMSKRDKLFVDLADCSDELVVALLSKLEERDIATIGELSRNFAVHRKAAEFDVMAPNNVSESIDFDHSINIK